MGTEAAWVPLVIGAISAGASAYNTRQVAKDQDNAAAIGIQNQAKKQREADDRVSAEVEAMNQSSPEASRKQATDAFMTQLRRTRGQAVAGGPAGASDRYTADLASAEGDVNQFGTTTADTLARINAPALQRQGEAQGFARLSSDLSQIGRAAGGEQFLNELRLRSIRRNPWIDAGASIGGGVAGGMASSQGRYGGGVTPGGTRTDVPVRTPGVVYG